MSLLKLPQDLLYQFYPPWLYTESWMEHYCPTPEGRERKARHWASWIISGLITFVGGEP